MAKAKESTTRTFVKTGPDGKQMTREVTGPASEVSALFDGYVEKPAAAKSASTTGTTGGTSRTSS